MQLPHASRKGLILRVACLLLVLCVSAADASWRCGARLVGVGQTIDDVYQLCGAPTDRTSETDYVTVRVSRDVAVTRPVVVDEWFYNRGPKQFVRYLVFRDGILVEIDEGTYGY
jgi:uncharacterized protein DUF2845